MKILSIPAFLTGLIAISLGVYFLGKRDAPQEVEKPKVPRPQPSGLIRSDREAVALFRSQFEEAQKSYLAYQQAIGTAAKLTSSRLSSMVEAEKVDTRRPTLIQIWSHSDPRAAAEHLRGWSRDDNFKEQAMGQAIETWGKQDSEAAITWLKNYIETESPDQDVFGLFGTLKDALVRGVARSDPHRALALLHELKRNGGSSKITFENSEDWSRVLDKDGESDFLLFSWFTNDREACESWLMAQNPERRTEALSSQVGHYLIHYADDPLTRATEIWTTLSGRRKSVAASNIISGLEARDPNLAAEWLNRFEGDPDLDSARAEFASKLTALDPEAAFVWTSAIHDPDRKADAEKIVFQEWDRLDPEAAESFYLAHGWDRKTIARLRMK